MKLGGRIDKLEASLRAQEKFSLWLHRAKAAGGFVPYWEGELAGSLAPLEWFEDEESHFLFVLVNEVNFTVLNNASKYQDLHAFAGCALDGMLRRICRPNESGVLVPVRPIPEIAARAGKSLCAKFRSLLEETEFLGAAIELISKTYLGGEDILFTDIRAIFDAEVSNLRTTADVFDPLAYWLQREPLTFKELDRDSRIVQAKADSIVHLARANALIGCSDLRKFKDALQRAFPDHSGLCSPLARPISVPTSRA